MLSLCSELLSRNLDPLYRTALRLTGNPPDAQDLVQETCLRACRAWAQLREPAGARAWLFRVLRTAWLDQVRKSARRPRLVSPEQAPPEAATDVAPVPDVVDAAERLALEQAFDEEVLVAMHELSEEERLAVMFQVFGGLSYREISDALGCPLGTVMSRLHRAKMSLRTRLADYAMRQGIIPRPQTGKGDEDHAQA